VVSGKLSTEKNLKIGSGAKIFANVMAASAIVSGEIQGNIKVRDSLELTTTAKVFGDVKANVLSIAAGAALHGRCQIGEEKKSKAEKVEKAEKIVEEKTALKLPKEKPLDFIK
jgi:cytoskeletal protein CcmA (bactofilin family)